VELTEEQASRLNMDIFVKLDLDLAAWGKRLRLPLRLPQEYKSKVAKENMHKAPNEKVGIPTQSDLLQEVIKKGLWQIRKQNAAV
jgi:hypothetical protein